MNFYLLSVNFLWIFLSNFISNNLRSTWLIGCNFSTNVTSFPRRKGQKKGNVCWIEMKRSFLFPFPFYLLSVMIPRPTVSSIFLFFSISIFFFLMLFCFNSIFFLLWGDLFCFIPCCFQYYPFSLDRGIKVHLEAYHSKLSLQIDLGGTLGRQNVHKNQLRKAALLGIPFSPINNHLP